jgi:crotonobetainyl-CoA:carnitine CoA-transferase CaiB-like acyl-CoA transferase
MKPLKNITVLDLTHAVAGPMCTYQLSLLGADVIKVEKPGVGDDTRHYSMHAGPKDMSAPFIAYNSGKRSIALDLKSPEAAAIIDRLVAKADVVVENFRPGVAAKLGLDAVTLRGKNPRIVYCSISGFGQTGPMRDWPAYDHIVQAISGVMMMSGKEGDEPIKIGIPVADCFSGYCAAFAIMSALFERAGTGEGRVIDVAMLDALLVLMSAGVITVGLTGKPPNRPGNMGFRLSATSSTYQTTDGFLALGANHQPQIENMCKVLGEAEILEDARYVDDDSRMKNRTALATELAEVFKTRSAEQLEPALAAAQVPAGWVRNPAQIIDHPHLRARETLLKLDVPGLDREISASGAGFKTDADAVPQARRVPTLGEHTDAVLRDLGFDEAQIADFRSTSVVS